MNYMSKKFTVKARLHHGTDSLDLTIPTQICRDLKINEGDVFSLEVITEGDKIMLSYQRIFANK
jgi:hypothetical protein